MDNKLSNIFENIYKSNVDQLFRFVLFRISDREEAIDIVEEVFVRLWKEMQKNIVREPRALLYKIARNLVIDWYRKEKSISIPTFSSGEDEEEIALEMFASKEIGADLNAEVSLIIEKITILEPIYREALYLRYVEELGPKEIAKILNQSPNVISVRLSRGLERLRSILHI